MKSNYHRNLTRHDRLKYLELAAERATIAILLGSTIVAIFEPISSFISGTPDKLIGICLVLQFSFLVASAFVLGYVEYVQKKEYIALYDNEKRREVWYFILRIFLTIKRECDNYIEGEITEMIELYHRRGLSKADAETVVNILSSNVQFFVDVMMKEELLLFPASLDPLLAGTEITDILNI